MSNDATSKHVVVIGAGVVGLTTAVKIQEQGGYNVTIVAETFPSDPKTIRYTSLWAGAHHVSHADGDKKQEDIDRETFDVMWELSKPGGEAEGAFLRLPQTDYYYDGRDTHLNWMPDFKPLPIDNLIEGAKTGASFTTLTIDTPVYCNYLVSRFLARGGTIVRAPVQHVSQIAEGGAHVFTFSRAGKGPRVDAIVACPGLGARTLGGVEDKDVFPTRGQVVMLRAPWINFGRTASHLKDGLWTYVIPRRSGDVIVGGTKVDNDWYPVARHETTLEILERSLALCPELAPPEVRAKRSPTVDDLLPIVIEEGCAFRPSRKGGIRLDVEWIEGIGGKIPLVFNYGHSGGGYQSSWGTANIALNLLQKSLSGTQGLLAHRRTQPSMNPHFRTTISSRSYHHQRSLPFQRISCSRGAEETSGYRLPTYGHTGWAAKLAHRGPVSSVALRSLKTIAAAFLRF